jgi:hypothetical protein
MSSALFDFVPLQHPFSLMPGPLILTDCKRSSHTVHQVQIEAARASGNWMHGGVYEFYETGALVFTTATGIYQPLWVHNMAELVSAATLTEGAASWAQDYCLLSCGPRSFTALPLRAVTDCSRTP